MPRTTIPSESCTFRLDSNYGFCQQFPMTFNNVGLSEDGFEFNGSSSYIEVPLTGRLFDIEMSWEIIFDYTNSGETQFLISKANDTGYDRDYTISISPSDSINIWFGENSTNYLDYSTSIEVENANNTLIVTRDSSNVFVYLNGVLVDSTTYDFTPIDKNQPFLIGANPHNLLSKRHFNDCIKKVSIYNKTLTPQEVADRYNEVTFAVE